MKMWSIISKPIFKHKIQSNMLKNGAMFQYNFVAKIEINSITLVLEY